MQRVAAIRSLVPAFREAINALKANPDGNLQILRSFPARDGVSKSTGVVAKRKTVCILDSSVRLVSSAVLANPHAYSSIDLI